MKCIKNSRCTQCGGTCQNGICEYCGSKDVVTEEIKSIIKPYDDINGYYEDKIRTKIFKGLELDSKEDNVFNLLLKNDMIEINALDDALIISYIIYGKKIISYDTFESLIKRATEKNMRQLGKGKIENYHPVANIVGMKDANGSAYDYFYVNFNKLIISELYKGFIYPLSTYYHEIHHVMQAILFHIGYVNYDLMIMLKEKIIRDYEVMNYKTDYYYKDNYYNISYEIDAQQNGLNDAQRFLSLIGYNNLEDYFLKLKNKWPKNENELERVIRINGEKKYKTVDEIFDVIIMSSPDYLEKYPQLNIEYVNDNGVVRKRTKEELSDIIMDYLRDENTFSYIEQLISNLNKKEDTIKQ